VLGALKQCTCSRLYDAYRERDVFNFSIDNLVIGESENSGLPGEVKEKIIMV
jgi:hypothetical protein